MGFIEGMAKAELMDVQRFRMENQRLKLENRQLRKQVTQKQQMIDRLIDSRVDVERACDAFKEVCQLLADRNGYNWDAIREVVRDKYTTKLRADGLAPPSPRR